MRNHIFLFVFLGFALLACRKEEQIDTSPDINIQFSTDSILFDTVFTNIGSTSRVFKVFNYNKKSIVLSSIQLLGGDNSNFKININGVSSSSQSNIKIRGNDSIYVFVKAFIDPTNSNSPYLVEDEIQFSFNGNTEKIPLVAYGQNAIYLNSAEFTSNTTLFKGKPYIITNYAKVNKNVVLTAEAGAKIYFNKSAKLLVNGTLIANGTLADSITFCSDRLERIYDDEPGQWEGIYLNSSSINNAIHHTTIKNALVGIIVDSLSTNSNPKLLITNSIVKNHEVAAILGYNASIVGINNLMFNCGQYLIAGFYGGSYSFYQNTFANYNFNFPRRTPSLYFTDNHITKTGNKALNTIVYNNIIFGSLIQELDFNQSGTLAFVKDFQNNIIKTNTQNLGTSNIYNVDPLFLNPRREEYELFSNSEASGKGKDLSSNVYAPFLTKDIKEKERIFPSTLGCYEN